MSRFFEAMRRYENERVLDREGEAEAKASPAVSVAEPSPSLTPLPVPPAVPGSLARAQQLKRLSERVAPLAILNQGVRLAISGCRPGDGASSVAAGIALDLSQRLGLRTLLLDAHQRHPTVFRMFATAEPVFETTGLLVRPTRWPRMEVATCTSPLEREYQQSFFDELERLIGRYAATIIDLGVVRLDARMLPLARPGDPILLVVRYGHTERRELATTTAALGAANRSIGGVILNASRSALPAVAHRLLSTGA